jgi:type I restriction enzyme S subunit
MQLKLPDDWKLVSIKDAAARMQNAIVGGPFGSDLVSTDYVDRGVPVIRGQNMSEKFVSGDFAYVTNAKASALSANLARPGDLMFTQRGTLGQISIVPNVPHEKYLVSQSQMKVTLDGSRHVPAYVYQYFVSNAGQKQIELSAIQTGVPHTNLGILKQYTFPAPLPSEQTVIATALGDVDELLSGLDKLIAKKRDLKRAAMQQLLTGKKRVPGFDGEWRVRSLGEIANVKTGSRNNEDKVDDGEFLSFPRFFAFQRPGVMQPYPLSAEPQASLA